MWQDLQAGKLRLDDGETRVAKVVALVAQAEFGDQTTNCYQLKDYEHILQKIGLQADQNLVESIVQLIDDSGELLPAVGYKLVSRKAAVALYRCITEMHSFYRCDTVSGDVSNQFCRDLKGTLVSIFNENSDLGSMSGLGVWCWMLAS
nr:hypothetical protein BaRGS_004715 [Batillaria attramentaria]